MAKECDKNLINSKINGVDDGTIEIKEGSGGELTGKHKKSNKPIAGQCTGGSPPHIMFARIGADGCVYIYQGEMEKVLLPREHYRIPPGKGTVTKICLPLAVNAKGRGIDRTPDEWVAEQDPT